MSACRRATSKSVDCFIPRSEPIVSLLEKIDYLLESTLSDPTFRRPESSGRRRARKRAPSWTRVGKTEWHLYEKGRHPKDAVNLEDMARET